MDGVKTTNIRGVGILIYENVGMLNGKEILITGGTGSLGKQLLKLLMTEHKPKGIRILSRDELKQWQLRNDFKALLTDPALPPVSFLIGDVRDAKRMHRACRGVDVLIHAAAMKQVPACEDNPLEAIKTNVDGAVNVLNAAIDCGVGRVMNVSTDKACKPVNLYGATKMAAEKLIVDGNIYAAGHGTILSSCRYGNVLGSRGSVAHVFKAQADAGLPITLTHSAMTRFWISLPTVARFLLSRIEIMQGGEIFVPKMKSMGVRDMAISMIDPLDSGSGWLIHRVSQKPVEFVTTGIRQGEKLHECLFPEEDYVYEYPDHYRVFASRNLACEQEIGAAKQWEFNSGRNPNGELTADELRAMLAEV